jgi:hypothetical protein
MLIQILTHRPEMIGPILSNTPGYVWGILASLIWLGASQLQARMASKQRLAIMPLAMLGLSIFSIVAAFGASAHLTAVIAVWLLALAAVNAIGWNGKPAAGSRYDAATRSFYLPGSVLPMLLIVGIFLTKYVVGIELAMQSSLAQDTSFVLPVAALYGVFNGIFMTRAVRILRLKSSDQRATQGLTAAA